MEKSCTEGMEVKGARNGHPQWASACDGVPATVGGPVGA